MDEPEKKAMSTDDSLRLEDQKYRLSKRLETYRSLVTHSAEGFKFLSLANGGAAVALLTYLGHFGNRTVKAPDMSCPMLLFLAGLVCAGAGWFSAYFTQLRLFQTEEAGSNDGRHSGWLSCAAVAYVLSLALFAVGCYLAVLRFPV